MKAAISFVPVDWRKPMIGEAGIAMQLRGSGIVTIAALDAIARSL